MPELANGHEGSRHDCRGDRQQMRSCDGIDLDRSDVLTMAAWVSSGADLVMEQSPCDLLGSAMTDNGCLNGSTGKLIAKINRGLRLLIQLLDLNDIANGDEILFATGRNNRVT